MKFVLTALAAGGLLASVASAQLESQRTQFYRDKGNSDLGFTNHIIQSAEAGRDAGSSYSQAYGHKFDWWGMSWLEYQADTKLTSLYSSEGPLTAYSGLYFSATIKLFGKSPSALYRATAFSIEPHHRTARITLRHRFDQWFPLFREYTDVLENTNEIRGGAAYVQQQVTIGGIVLDTFSKKKGVDHSKTSDTSILDSLDVITLQSGASTIADREIVAVKRSFTVGPFPVTVKGSVSVGADHDGSTLTMNTVDQVASVESSFTFGPRASISAGIDFGVASGGISADAKFANVTSKGGLAMGVNSDPSGYFLLTTTAIDLAINLWVEINYLFGSETYTKEIYSYSAWSETLVDKRF